MKFKIILITVTILAVLFAMNSCTLDQTTRNEGKTTDKPGKSVIQPGDQNKEGLANVPDIPYTTIPKILSVKDVVEHRTALHGRQVTVKGYVVEAILGEEACPTGQGGNIMEPQPQGCAQPRVFLADTMDKTRDIKYDLMILLGDEQSYKEGQPVEIKGIVSASKVAVVMSTVVF